MAKSHFWAANFWPDQGVPPLTILNKGESDINQLISFIRCPQKMWVMGNCFALWSDKNTFPIEINKDEKEWKIPSVHYIIALRSLIIITLSNLLLFYQPQTKLFHQSTITIIFRILGTRQVRYCLLTSAASAQLKSCLKKKKDDPLSISLVMIHIC